MKLTEDKRTELKDKAALFMLEALNEFLKKELDSFEAEAKHIYAFMMGTLEEVAIALLDDLHTKNILHCRKKIISSINILANKLKIRFEGEKYDHEKLNLSGLDEKEKAKVKDQLKELLALLEA